MHKPLFFVTARQYIQTKKPLLPVLFVGVLFAIIGFSLLVKPFYSVVQNPNFWQGISIFFGLLSLTFGSIAIIRFIHPTLLKQKKHSQSAPGHDEKKAPFPFDVLAGHHCAVLISMGNTPQKTYLIPNIGHILHTPHQNEAPLDSITLAHAVTQLRNKGLQVHMLKSKTQAPWYTPLMGNPKRDIVRIPPFDIVFVNWN